MRCPNCGNENPPDYVFCDECGARLQDMGGGDVAAANAGMDSTPMDSSPLGSGDSTHAMDSSPLKEEHPSGPTGTSDQQWQSEDSTYAPSGGDMASGGLPTGATDSGDLQDTWQYPTADAQGQQPSGDSQSADPTAAAASAAPSVSPMASHASEVTPVTEDTMADTPAAGEAGSDDVGTQEQTYTYVPDTGGTAATADAQQEASPMPDVVPIADEAPPTPAGISPAAAGTPVDETMDAGSVYAHDASADMSAGAAGGGGEWASSALAQLDQAQQALAGGDWGGFGQSMAALRSLLENASKGGTPAAGHAGPRTDNGATAGTGISAASSPAADMSAYTSPKDTGGADTGVSDAAGYEGSKSQDQQENGIPAVEPAAEAGTLDASAAGAGTTYDVGAGAGTDDGQATGADTGVSVGAGTGTDADTGDGTGASIDAGAATMVPATGATGGAASMLARLVVISTGAELPLPDQEEITVGREDPSSGIFPDVDLTPYGGEEGGVSRRHARILFIENEYYVEDLQSTNYTKVDGQRLPAHIRERVEDGARIDFGRVAVIFRRS